MLLTRNEHCPPHVHAGTAQWDARFQFSFWHNGVRLWDVTPTQNEPKAALLEELRLELKLAAHLKRARSLWWRSRQTVCLDNQRWNVITQQVVNPKDHLAGAVDILAARFDEQNYLTILELSGQNDLVEIAL